MRPIYVVQSIEFGSRFSSNLSQISLECSSSEIVSRTLWCHRWRHDHHRHYRFEDADHRSASLQRWSYTLAKADSAHADVAYFADAICCRSQWTVQPFDKISVVTTVLVYQMRGCLLVDRHRCWSEVDCDVTRCPFIRGISRPPCLRRRDTWCFVFHL